MHCRWKKSLPSHEEAGLLSLQVQSYCSFASMCEVAAKWLRSDDDPCCAIFHEQALPTEFDHFEVLTQISIRLFSTLLFNF